MRPGFGVAFETGKLDDFVTITIAVFDMHLMAKKFADSANEYFKDLGIHMPKPENDDHVASSNWEHGAARFYDEDGIIVNRDTGIKAVVLGRPVLINPRIL